MMPVFADNVPIQVPTIRAALNTWSDTERKVLPNSYCICDFLFDIFLQRVIVIILKNLLPGEQARFLEAIMRTVTADGNSDEWRSLLLSVILSHLLSGI